MKELSTVMRSLGQNPTDAEVQDIINEVDVDGSGSMEFPEFCIMMVKKMAETDTENEVQEAYRVFDKDKDGFITRQELRMIFAALPERLMPEQIEEMLDAADDDGIEVDILDLLFLFDSHYRRQAVADSNMKSSKQCLGLETIEGNSFEFPELMGRGNVSFLEHYW